MFLHVATDSKAEMKATLWGLPSDFDDIPAEDHSSHQSLELICHLDSADYGDMKRYIYI